MIRHAVDRQKFVIATLYNSTDVFIKFFLPGIMDNTFPVLYCKNSLYVNLGVGICHDLFYITSLTGLFTNLTNIFLPTYCPSGTKRKSGPQIYFLSFTPQLLNVILFLLYSFALVSIIFLARTLEIINNPS